MEKSEYFIDEYGDKYWYLPSKGQHYIHREDGPACERKNGTKIWYKNNQIHREDGPAIEEASSLKLKKWYLFHQRLPDQEIKTWLKENDIDIKTLEGLAAFKLRWM